MGTTVQVWRTRVRSQDGTEFRVWHPSAGGAKCYLDAMVEKGGIVEEAIKFDAPTRKHSIVRFLNHLERGDGLKARNNGIA